EAWLAKADQAFVDHALSEINAPEPEIQRQAVLSLGELPDASRINHLAKFASQGSRIEAMDEAFVSGIAGLEITFLKQLT
ncbi:MAG: hypothetical protein ACKVI3_11055, partial [Verrucomicrobiia bacterium]